MRIELFSRERPRGVNRIRPAKAASADNVVYPTGLGATGALRSILAGATDIASALSGERLETSEMRDFQWDSECLYFSIRGPWPSKTSTASITFGNIAFDTPLVVVSEMPDHGVIFSDGIESDFLHFTADTRATVRIADKKGQLVT